jgi:hypothetical protein
MDKSKLASSGGGIDLATVAFFLVAAFATHLVLKRFL